MRHYKSLGRQMSRAEIDAFLLEVITKENEKIESMERAKTSVRLGKKPPAPTVTDGWRESFLDKVVGQPGAEKIIPYITTFQAGMNPVGRPAGVFLLTGPTGSGKTRTPEALADALHGDATKLLRLDCAEYNLEHSVASLLGAPPGYIGHKETTPVITQAKLNAVSSSKCRAKIVLFDEIEKAHPAMHQLLLGVMDKGTLTPKDGTTVDFEETFIFMTSNTGAADMERESRGGMGFQRDTSPAKAGEAALNRRFSPEWRNRLDEIIVYNKLDRAAIAEILTLILNDYQYLLRRRGKHINVRYSKAVTDWLIDKADYSRYGARDLKRIVQRYVQQPLAEHFNAGTIDQYSQVQVQRRGDGLDFKVIINAEN